MCQWKYIVNISITSKWTGKLIKNRMCMMIYPSLIPAISHQSFPTLNFTEGTYYNLWEVICEIMIRHSLS